MAHHTLAIHGGKPVRSDPMPVEKRFSDEELDFLKQALEQNTLFYWSGAFVKKMLDSFKHFSGQQHAAACTSGTAAIHAALGAMGIQPGDEVITSPITDVGTVIGILYQNAVPVFADLDPHTYNLDPESVENAVTEHTKAVIAVHLAGNPCDMDALSAICQRHGLTLIEDCAQAWGCRYDGKHVGTIGDLGCYSLNDFKHISVGDGGIVASMRDEYGRSLQWWTDKCYKRLDKRGDPDFLAPNYRMSELQGAVGLAQLNKLESIASRRNHAGRRLTEQIAGLPGIRTPATTPKGTHSYWFYLIRTDPEVITDRAAFVESIQAEGIPCSPGYVETPMYAKPFFLNKNFFNGGDWPVETIRGESFDYRWGMCPVAEKIIKDCVLFPLKESYDDAVIDDMAAAIQKVAHAFVTRGAFGRTVSNHRL